MTDSPREEVVFEKPTSAPVLTAHELARKLLAGPDTSVLIYNRDGDNGWNADIHYATGIRHVLLRKISIDKDENGKHRHRGNITVVEIATTWEQENMDPDQIEPLL